MMQPSSDPSPWWRHRMMWLVVGGPLLVVVAAIVTGVIAVLGADPVLETADLKQTRGSKPALQGRNHAASPATTKP
jgi:uncharacterized protein